MKKILIGLSALLVVFFSGCATPYQPKSAMGGFSDTRLGEDLYSVTFKGNGYTDKERVHDFVLLRSAELTLKSGYKYFIVMDSKDDVSRSSYTTPTTYNTYGNVSTYGNTGYYSGTTYASGGQTFTATRHRAAVNVKCFKKKPKLNIPVYSANFVSDSIKSKYKIK